jgi:hypothetical protein
MSTTPTEDVQMLLEMLAKPICPTKMTAREIEDWVHGTVDALNRFFHEFCVDLGDYELLPSIGAKLALYRANITECLYVYQDKKGGKDE